MRTLLNHPIMLFLASLAYLWLMTVLGNAIRVRRESFDEARRSDYDLLVGATLTLLSLIVGFSFSMAASRYDLRKNYEEAEANAIGTAYSRVSLLSAPDTAKLRALLREYTDLRIRFYKCTDIKAGRALDAPTLRTQEQLWATVSSAASAAPSALSALAAAAMNDAINSQGYAQAAGWNRIPLGAWVLLYVLGGVATLLIGFRFHADSKHSLIRMVFPGLVATAFFLIADIDCPQQGVIRIEPENLQALAATLR